MNSFFQHLSNAIATIGFRPVMANNTEAATWDGPVVDDVLTVKAELIEKFKLPLE